MGFWHGKMSKKGTAMLLELCLFFSWVVVFLYDKFEEKQTIKKLLDAYLLKESCSHI